MGKHKHFKFKEFLKFFVWSINPSIPPPPPSPKNFMVPFCGWDSTATRLEPLRGGSLRFTTTFPEISATHFTNLERMRGWVDLGATQWFWIWDPWIGDPAPWPLGRCSMGKKDFHSMGKVWKNTDISDFWVSYIYRVKQKSIQFPKYGKSEFT